MHVNIKRMRTFFLNKTIFSEILNVTQKQKMEKSGWVRPLSLLSFITSANGVAVLIKRNLPFQIEELDSDPNGLIEKKLLKEVITLINIYAPNVNNVPLKGTSSIVIPS